MKVNICGVYHEVVETEDKFDMDCHMGQINYSKAEILINRDMPMAMQEETLCHEMAHGMLVHIGRHDLAQDETLCQALGNAIYQGFTPKTY